jgi:4'-phosphopantetheinyl transferase EntD
MADVNPFEILLRSREEFFESAAKEGIEVAAGRVEEQSGRGIAPTSLEKSTQTHGLDAQATRSGIVQKSADVGSERRKHESEAARSLARGMLERHGVRGAEIPRHPAGFPIWPSGWVGSLSHSSGWCAAAQARDTVVRGIGVDIENPARMKPPMWAHILTEGERRGWATLADDESALRATAIFGAKEALFKTLAPFGRTVPGFLEVEIEWTGAGRFQARMPSDTVEGRCVAFDEIVLTVAWLAAK